MKNLPTQSARLGLTLTILAMLGLSACGRRGPLELPPDATPAVKPASSASAASKLAPNGGGQSETPAVTPPKAPYFLDPLL